MSHRMDAPAWRTRAVSVALGILLLLVAARCVQLHFEVGGFHNRTKELCSRPVAKTNPRLHGFCLEEAP